MGTVTTAGLIALALQEAPEIGALIAKLYNAGLTVPTAEQLASLQTSDSDLAAAYERLFPGQTMPTG